MENLPTESKDIANESYRKNADASIEKTGLHADAFNAWMGIMQFSRNQNPDDNAIKSLRTYFPIPKYGERYGVYLNDDGTVNERQSSLNLYIRNSSNPEKVREYNDLADEVNADLERMIMEKDTRKAAEYFQKIHKLLYGREYAR
ncbi:MAG: hypothetical protein WC764_00650 [Candidatus Paceibacterota bacterium]|jgi:hypothetical protein